MERIYRFRVVTYPSGRTKCYIQEEKKHDKDRTHWMVTGLDAPRYMISKGYKVEVEYKVKQATGEYQ